MAATWDATVRDTRTPTSQRPGERKPRCPHAGQEEDLSLREAARGAQREKRTKQMNKKKKDGPRRGQFQ